MAPQHLDRLSTTDAAFLHLEEGGAHMHIGGVALMEGPPPDHDEFVRHLAGRLPLAPRYRQKLAYPPGAFGRPVWVDDPNFNIDYHVRRTALPHPGTEEQLHLLVGRVMSQRLDRTKPLWELWVVEGLDDGRFAFVSKTHHCLVDGVGGVDLMTTLFDLERNPTRGDADAQAWRPQRPPSRLRLASRVVEDLVANAASVAGTALTAATSPSRLAAAVGDVAGAAAEGVKMLARPAPETPLNVVPGPHRRYTVVRERLSDLKAVKDAYGGTVNDVVLTCVAAALGRFLAARGVDTDGLTLRACVPMSVRTEDKKNAGGNEITIMVAPLPVGEQDAIERLADVSASMRDLKGSKQALSARLLTEMENFAPPNVLARASRLGFSPKLYNLLVTNVPGPQFPVYMQGRELLEVFPVAFLAPVHAVAIAILSYNGAVNFGLIGDYDAVPDLDLLGKEIDSALTELVKRAHT